MKVSYTTPKLRVIARLDIKGEDLIKGINFEGVRKLGRPDEFARRYYQAGIDEILYIDAVASLYGRNNLVDVVERTTRDIFVPLTVGGGVKSVEDVESLLRAGADKIAVNTAAISNPKLLSEIAKNFGSQCLVVSIQAKRTPNGWECYVDQGREKTGKQVLEWVKEVQDLGAGELLIASVDKDGTRKGMDVDLVRSVCDLCAIPVVAGSGLGSELHAVKLLEEVQASAIVVGAALHHGDITVSSLKSYLCQNNINVRS